jgi:hypothetical protein
VDQCGVHRTFTGTIERGESTSVFRASPRVAATLGISLSTLFHNLEEKSQKPCAAIGWNTWRPREEAETGGQTRPVNAELGD